MADDVMIVDQAGTVVRTLVGAEVQRIVESLDPFEDEVIFTFPKHDPLSALGQGADVHLLNREVQVWRDGTKIAWAVLRDADGSSGAGDVAVTCPGLAWWFTRLRIDRPRQNYIPNPGFEDDLTDWMTFGGATATIIASPRRLGAKAVRLENTVTDADAGIRTSFSITGLHGIGTNVYVDAHYLLESFSGEAVGNLSLRVVASLSGVEQQRREMQLGSGDELASVDGWLREEIAEPIWVPPDTTFDFAADLMAPNGSIVWDASQAVIPESLGDFDVDLATVIGLIIADVQDPTYKKDLGFTTDTPPTGITIPTYAKQYTEHTPAAEAIREIVDRDDGPDWWIDLDRVVHTAHPRRGTDRTATFTLVDGPGGNVASWSLQETGLNVETHVTYYGDGDGPDREEGYAIDTSELDGLVLQGVYQAGPGTSIDQLEPLARGQLAPKKRLGRFLTVTTKPDLALVALLRPGDTVASTLADGWMNGTGNWRITKTEHVPATQNLVLTLAED